MSRWRALVVAGPAGSDKSTLGRDLADRLGAVLLDLDSVTNPLLDALGDAFEGHWNAAEHRDVVRPARYDALLSVAHDQVGRGLDLVLVAPFTAELAGGDEWDSLCAATAPEAPYVVWLDLPAALREQRILGRGESRDSSVSPKEAAAPRVPHLRVDATLTSAAQADLVLRSLP